MCDLRILAHPSESAPPMVDETTAAIPHSSEIPTLNLACHYISLQVLMIVYLTVVN